jgi:hypothetical protein
MGMIYQLKQASESTLALLIEDPPQFKIFTGLHEFSAVAKADPQMAAIWELLVKADPIPEPRDGIDRSGEAFSLEKAWYGVHYLLTNADNQADWPAPFLLHGGQELTGVDTGYGSPTVYRPADVHAISQYLEDLTPNDLSDRFNAEEMNESGVYPQTWEDDELSYLLDYIGELAMFVRRTSDQKLGLVCWLS